jgi:xanthine dehydrogenase accessory factor
VIEIDAIIAALSGAPGQPAALATLVAVEGSSYRRPGARLLVLADDRRVGSISGGCLEEDVLLRARRVLESGRSETAVYDTTDENDLVWGVGLGCRGVVQIFIEPISMDQPHWIAVLAANRAANLATKLAVIYGENFGGLLGTHLCEELPRKLSGPGTFVETIATLPRLVIFGAGDDAQPLVRLAKETGWRVAVIDSRGNYATAMRFPDADSITVASAEESVTRLKLDDQTHVVVMTHRFAEDVKLLGALLARPLAYLGVLGARKRTDRVLAELGERGFVFSPEILDRLCAPVGLDLGATTPETIALSIVAELQCSLAGRTPIHLRDRVAPIHG